MAQVEPSYWRLPTGAVEPGGEVAVHDGGVTMDRIGQSQTAGPGSYRVIVRRAGGMLPGDPALAGWPIELHKTVMGVTSAGGQAFRFNPGMARWFGLRLIEAAAICEAYDVKGGATPAAASGEIRRLSEWFQQNAADWIGEGSAVDNAIRLLERAKSVVADHPELAPDPETEASTREGIVVWLRGLAQRLVDDQNAPAALELTAARRRAIDGGRITPELFASEVVEYFTPRDQAIIRGRINL